MSQRVLVLALDGHDEALFAWLQRHGALPALAAVRDRSARFRLDTSTGGDLLWQSLVSGQTPDQARRWSSLVFDPNDYGVAAVQSAAPFFAASLACETVVIDLPGLEWPLAGGKVQGIVGWGRAASGAAWPADPVQADSLRANPPELAGELAALGLTCPDRRLWPDAIWRSPALCAALARDLVRAVDARSALAQWLLRQRLPRWRLGILVVPELRQAIEALWHGVDSRHPLHGRVASSAAAGRGLIEVYRAVDRLVGSLLAQFADCRLVLFGPQSMGTQAGDVAGLALLPELLWRDCFGADLRPGLALRLKRGDLPGLGDSPSWTDRVAQLLPTPPGAADALPPLELDARPEWTTALRYRPFWPRMTAFALPSSEQGRVRINLAGRERAGIVGIEAYARERARLEALLMECRNPLTGAPVVRAITRASVPDPRQMQATECDLTVSWNGPLLGLQHPRLGRIGPLPFRCSGGGGGPGSLWIAGSGIPAADIGSATASDLVASIVDLLGASPLPLVSGRSLFRRGALDRLADIVEDRGG